MVVLSGGKPLGVSLLPPDITGGSSASSVPEVSAPKVAESNPAPALDIHDAETKLIEQALEKCGGNRTKAAELLGISRRTLQRKLAGMESH